MPRFKVYVDGSYNKEKKEIYGAFVTLYDEVPVMIYRVTTKNPIFADQWNVGGELLAAAAGIVNTINCLKEARENGTCKDTAIVVFHDFIGIQNFIVPPKVGKKPWTPKNKEGAGAYYKNMVELVLEQNYPLKVRFEKVRAHTGVKWNEFADKIAGGYIKSYNGLQLIEQTI